MAKAVRTEGSSKVAAQETEKRTRAEMERRTGKSAEDLYQERDKRVRDAVQLREPDRIPIHMPLGYFPCRHTGVSASAAFYDTVAWTDACRQTVLDYEPDEFTGTTGAGFDSGGALGILDAIPRRWPGGNLPPDAINQFVEAEYMKEDEYYLFLFDPSDFMLRFYLPRVFGALEPLAKLPPIRSLSGTFFTSVVPLLATPEFQRVGQAILKAGQEKEKWRVGLSAFAEEMTRLGFPSADAVANGCRPSAAFDIIACFLRCMGVYNDMHRRPDQLLAACDKIVEWQIRGALPADPAKGRNPRVTGYPTHRSSDIWMSPAQFKTFYWPSLKKALLTNSSLGYVTSLNFQGKSESRLELFRELPRGSVIFRIDDPTDMPRAKAVVGGYMCIMASVPATLVQLGSPSEVEEFCKDLIAKYAKGGGLIITAASSLDTAKPENVKVVCDTVKKYGRY